MALNKVTNTLDNLPIKDAKIGVVFNIHKTDVKTGKIKNPDDCVVARACKRAFTALEVKVHTNRVYVRTKADPKVWTRFVVPASVKNEIIAFDRGGKFEPGKFNLRAPSPSQTKAGSKKLAAKRKRNTAAENAKRSTTVKGRKEEIAKKPKRFLHVTKNIRIAA